MTRMRMRGMTLVELVIVIVILGILASVAALVLAPAFQAYFASQRRAQISDTADAAARRLLRDVRLALPNSARVDGSNRFLEILLTRSGGRYRSLNDDDNPAVTAEQPLAFGTTITSFDAYEPLALAQIPLENRVQAGDYVVIHNLGIPGADAYDFVAANPNIKRIAAFAFPGGAIANENRITVAAASNPFPLESPGRRFFVVTGPVTYACTNVGLAGGDGTGRLQRWSGYSYDPSVVGAIANSGGPPLAAPAGAASTVLAENLSACEFTYSNNVAQLARGLVRIRLTITQASESVTLYYEAHVNNVP